jgi:hypothetical protein
MSTKPLMVQTPAEQQESVRKIFGDQPKPKVGPASDPKGVTVMKTVEVRAGDSDESPKTNDQARTDAVKKAMGQ